MVRKLDRLQEQFMKALEEAPLHSTLGRWMIEHRDELEALFRKGKPDWAAIAEHFDRAGLRDEADRRPTAGATERTWRLVRAAAGRAAEHGSPAVPAAHPKGRGQAREPNAAAR
jgi:hypothetical protein